MNRQELKIGDRIRISVALLKDIWKLPQHQSPTVRLREIREEADGTLTLVVEREYEDVQGV